MGQTTSIEWTNASWSPFRAHVKVNAAEIAREKGYTSLVKIAEKMAGRVGPHCEHVSHGCDNCYSETNNHRCLPSNGTGLPFDRCARDLIDSFVDDDILNQPLHWKQSRKIFVNSQTDTFGEWITDEMLDQLFSTMLLCPQHIFQVLTKRPRRILEYYRNPSDLRDRIYATLHDQRFFPGDLRRAVLGFPSRAGVAEGIAKGWRSVGADNIWMGVSVENQATADERIPLLLQTPAEVSFVSYEPALGPIDFLYPKTLWPKGAPMCCNGVDCACMGKPIEPPLIHGMSGERVAWIIVGGESGPGARPFNVDWARSTVAQCKAAGVSCFVKQLGAHVIQNGERRFKRDRKGGDWHEWEHDIRVRQFPEVTTR